MTRLDANPPEWHPRLQGLECPMSAAQFPVPLRLTVCGPPIALSSNASFAVDVPVAVGLNATLMVQLPPTTSVVPQVDAVLTNELALVPEKVMPLLNRVTATVLVFFAVMTLDALVDPTLVVGNAMLAGARDTVGVGATVVQSLTRFRALIEPNPVARSYPFVVV